MRGFLLNVKLTIDLLYSITKLSILLFLIYFSYNNYQKAIELKNSIVILYHDIKTNYLKHIENENLKFNQLYNTIEKQQEFIKKQVNEKTVAIDSSKLIMNIVSDVVLSKIKFFKK